jgi:tRNA (uracil-5-)-methyltransferase
VEFLSSTQDEVLVTLIYHKKIDSTWQKEAKNLSDKLNIRLIGRSRGVKIVVDEDFINEVIDIEGESYRYKLYEGSFSQPNAFVNREMIGWVVGSIKKSERDLLELYCGHGNFTFALSKKFRRVLATEISKSSIKAAIELAKLNTIDNIDFVRLSSKELSQALCKKREFNRLRGVNLNSFEFETVFVDPPRAGIDKDTLEVIKRYQKIIYISCNPKTLKRDLDLLKDFSVEKFAMFDQFPYTRHIELGMILSRCK